MCLIECSFFIFAYRSKIEFEISIENNYFSTNFEFSISKYRSYTLFSDNCVSSNVLFLYSRVARRSNSKFRSKLIILSSSRLSSERSRILSVSFQMILLAVIYSHFSTQTLILEYLNLLHAFSKNRSNHRIFFSHIPNIFTLYKL